MASFETLTGVPTAANRVFSMPEICKLIIQQLPRLDVVSCLTVSDDVWRTAVEVIYRQVDENTASLVGAQQCSLARYTTYCQSVRYVTLEEELCESLSEVPILAVASIYPNVASIRASFSILYISDSITSGDNSSDVMEDEYSEREEAQDGEGEEGEDHTLEEDFLEEVVSGFASFMVFSKNTWSSVELVFDDAPSRRIKLTDSQLLGPKYARIHGHLSTHQFGMDGTTSDCSSTSITWALMAVIDDYSILRDLEVFRCKTVVITPQVLAVLIKNAPQLHTISARVTSDVDPAGPSSLHARLKRSKLRIWDIRKKRKFLSRGMKVPASLMKDLRVVHLENYHFGDAGNPQEVMRFADFIRSGKGHCKFPVLEELHLWAESPSVLEQDDYALSVVNLVSKSCQIYLHYASPCGCLLPHPGSKMGTSWEALVDKRKLEIALLRSLVNPTEGWKQIKNENSDEEAGSQEC